MSNMRSLEGYDEEFEDQVKKEYTNHLLVIAINTYQNGIRNLNNAVRDAETVTEVLQSQYDFSPSRTKIFTNEQATRESIIEAFEYYCENLGENDNLLFYYSGHGELYKTLNEGYWIPFDGRQNSRASWLANSTVKRHLENMSAHHILGIVDSCFSGSLFRSTKSDISHTLKTLDSMPSRWLITAGRETVVSDGPEGGHSPFAKTLISHLRKNAENALSTSTLSNRILMSPSLNRTHAKPRGEALHISGSEGGEFIFYKKGYIPTGEESPNNEKEETLTKTVANPSQNKETNVPAPPREQNPPQQFTPASLKTYLRNLIADGSTKQALDLLGQKLNNDNRLASDIILLKGRFNRMEKQYSRGVLTEAAYGMQTNQINHAFLSYLDDLEETDIIL